MKKLYQKKKQSVNRERLLIKLSIRPRPRENAYFFTRLVFRPRVLDEWVESFSSKTGTFENAFESVNFWKRPVFV